MNRQEALKLLNEKMKNTNLVKHCLAAEACMRELAHRFNADEDLWGMTGLLHDIDYEETNADPARHGLVGAKILEQLGLPAEAVHAIRVHSGHAPAESPIDWALYATDPLTGLIVASTLMHPSKKLNSLDLEFVIRRFKEKRFAAGANREQILSSANLGLELNDFIALCLKGMQGVSDQLGL